jgi:bifunctional DNase/RNase
MSRLVTALRLRDISERSVFSEYVNRVVMSGSLGTIRIQAKAQAPAKRETSEGAREVSSMAMVRMDIGTVVIGAGPISSLVVLDEHDCPKQDALHLPIKVGTVEASNISMGVDECPARRPMTHDLLSSVISSLDARLASVAITGVRDTTFYAQLNLIDADGDPVAVDARPSDAIALAVRENATIFVDEAVLETAAAPDLESAEREEMERKAKEFHDFIENVSPDDFNAAGREGTNPNSNHTSA